MVIPPQVSLLLGNVASVPPRNSVSIVTKSNNGTLRFKGKPFNCESMRKVQLQKIATAMGLNPRGFIRDLCKRINDDLAA